MLCLDALKDALEQERESHQQRLEETVRKGIKCLELMIQYICFCRQAL